MHQLSPINKRLSGARTDDAFMGRRPPEIVNPDGRRFRGLNPGNSPNSTGPLHSSTGCQQRWRARGIQVTGIIILLFLLNFLTGLFFINDGLFHSDSIFIAQAVEKTYSSGALQPSFRGRYGSVAVNFLFSLPFLLVGKNADLPVRICSIFFHAASIVMLFLLAMEYTKSRRTAVFSALLLSFMPFYFSPNTYGKEHGLSVFLFLAALAVQTRGIARQSRWLACGAALLCLCSVTVRESMLAVIPVFFFAALQIRVTRKPFHIQLFKEKGSKHLFLLSTGVWVALFLLVCKAYLSKELAGALFTEGHSATHWEFCGDYMW